MEQPQPHHLSLTTSSTLWSKTPRSGLTRHLAATPCLICGGHAALPQGRGIRCAGFTLERAVYCTREEYAGRLALDFSTEPPTYRHWLTGPCGCGLEHCGWAVSVAERSPVAAPEPVLDAATKDAIYQEALTLLALRPEALADLTRRGLSEDDADVFGFRSFPRRGGEHQALLGALIEAFGETALRTCPGFTDKNGRLAFWTASPGRDGYVVPFRAQHGRITGLQARVLGGRYLTAHGTRMDDLHHVVGTPRRQDLYVTEGALKGTVAAVLGGISTFAVAGQTLRPAHVAEIRALEPARVLVALDQEDNPRTEQARERWLRLLSEAGLPTYVAVWEGGDLGGPKGLDDLFQSGGRPRIRRATFVPSAFGERRLPYATDATGHVDGGGSLAEARALTASAIDSFVGDARHSAGKALLISSSAGVGKSTALARSVREHRTAARVLVGTKQLAAELASEHGYVLIEGRNEENCERSDVAHALGEAGHDVERLACGTLQEPRCPARATCGYWAQFQRPGPRVAATEQLFNPHFLAGGSIAALDDADLLRSVVERRFLYSEVLARSVDQLRQRRRRPLARLIQFVQHAVIDAPERALIGADVWDHLARVAMRYRIDLGNLARSLPEKPTIPAPETDAGGGVTLASIEDAPPATVLDLVRALREELPAFESGAEFNSRLRLSTKGIEVWSLRAPVPDHNGLPILPRMALLVLDATPIEPLVTHVSRHHERLTDVRATVRLPENVTVVQYAGSSNGHTLLADEARLQDAVSEVGSERRSHPVARPEAEAAVVFKRHRDAFSSVGFAESQVLTFGSIRGTNALVSAERLHVVGRPMPPSDDLVFLAQVVHHDEPPVSAQLTLAPRRYGGQHTGIDVVDFSDERVSALLRAQRDDELTQVIHRARLFTLDPQLGLEQGDGRPHVRVVLHTSHPLPGLRVDELHLPAAMPDLNQQRQDEAERRVWHAVTALISRGEELTDAAVAREASASRSTVAKARSRGIRPPADRSRITTSEVATEVGTPVHTLRGDPSKGVSTCPQVHQDNPRSSSPAVVGGASILDRPGYATCLGGCGDAVPAGQKCSSCAAAAVAAWSERRRRP